MTGSLRGSWGRKDTPRNEKGLRDNAEKEIRERDDVALKRLQDLQGKEIGALVSEQAFLAQEQARDVKPRHEKEIAGINARFDRRARELNRKHNSLWGKVSRVFGGHKRQQARMQRVERERTRDVDNRKGVQERNERLRQKSLGDRMDRVERDLRETKERHGVARDEFRQQREKGFEQAVRMEMNRQRSRGRSRSM
jgi:hypothetical protein